MKALGMESSYISIESDLENVSTIKAEISEIHEVVIDGTTYYYYLIENGVYRASIKINEYQPFFKVGDIVEVDFVPNEITNINAIVGIKK